jgi:hypothetical protein
LDINTLLVAGNLITQFADIRAKTLSRNYNDIDFVIRQITICYTACVDNFNAAAIELVPQFHGVMKQISETNRLTSAGFNLIKFFSPGETMHSNLLAYLLNPRAAHGQKNLFLNVFLEKLGIENLNKDREDWIVTAETGRIDILLRRADPHSVVIIENKSNFANDQPNQLYRYWHQEIYNYMRHKEDSYIRNPPAKYYQLIYLSPEHWKTPSLNSISKPEGWDDFLPTKIPLEYQHILFRHFIVSWLTTSLLLLPDNNHRIKQFVIQYIEFWT